MKTESKEQQGQMVSTDHITFVVAVNNLAILRENFLASPCLRAFPHTSILLQEHFTSAAKAYNDAIEKSPNDLMVFCHQDVFLPEAWLSDLQQALHYLEHHDPSWGVLGCSGITIDEQMWGHVYSSGLGVIGRVPEHPAPVQTLDEIVLILRKSSGLRFDETLPYFHLYGADICLAAAEHGRTNYAISAFCIHNTHQMLVLPREFYECCKHVRRVWKARLPIQTTCIRITHLNLPVLMRRIHDLYVRYGRRPAVGTARVRNVGDVLEELTCCRNQNSRNVSTESTNVQPA